jgi:hypothetical protein
MVPAAVLHSLARLPRVERPTKPCADLWFLLGFFFRLSKIDRSEEFAIASARRTETWGRLRILPDSGLSSAEKGT